MSTAQSMLIEDNMKEFTVATRDAVNNLAIFTAIGCYSPDPAVYSTLTNSWIFNLKTPIIEDNITYVCYSDCYTIMLVSLKDTPIDRVVEALDRFKNGLR